nr:hypothetical protein [uncultured Pseudomonas sp.]
MNKQIIAALLAAGFSLSSGVVSAVEAFEGNVTVAAADCALLAESVTLGVSANVVGAYDCSEENNLVKVAACSSGGSRQQGVACNFILDENDQPTEALPEGCEAQGGFSTIPDYKAFYTSSAGGVMQEKQLGTRCTDTSIVGIDGF